jgi:RNA polymerase sigma-70 factor (ECF subfamily)
MTLRPSERRVAFVRRVGEAGNDGHLGDAIMRGDTQALARLVEHYWAPLISSVRQIVSADAANDAVQQAFVRLWQHRSDIRDSSAVGSYVYQTARNIALKEKKSVERRARLNRIRLDVRSAPTTPLRHVEQQEIKDAIDRALSALPERRREAFVLAHLHGLPHRTIAEMLGLAPQTVANHISAALTDLRKALEPHC